MTEYHYKKYTFNGWTLETSDQEISEETHKIEKATMLLVPRLGIKRMTDRTPNVNLEISMS